MVKGAACVTCGRHGAGTWVKASSSRQLDNRAEGGMVGSRFINNFPYIYVRKIVFVCHQLLSHVMEKNVNTLHRSILQLAISCETLIM